MQQLSNSHLSERDLRRRVYAIQFCVQRTKLRVRRQLQRALTNPFQRRHGIHHIEDCDLFGRARRRWSAEQLKLDPDQVVFVDETWAKTNMTRAYGRSPRGMRLAEGAPYGR
jgi:hypothetical protein